MATDNFNRTENPLAGSWTTASGTGNARANGSVANVVSATLSAIRWTADTFAADQYSQCVLTAVSGGIIAGPAVRMSRTAESHNCYVATVVTISSQTRVRLYRYDDGTATQLGAEVQTSVSANAVVRLEASGSTLTVFVDDTQILQRTDSTHTAGDTGLSWNAGRGLDDWEGGVLLTSESFTASGGITFSGTSIFRYRRGLVASGADSIPTNAMLSRLASAMFAGGDAFGLVRVGLGAVPVSELSHSSELADVGELDSETCSGYSRVDADQWTVTLDADFLRDKFGNYLTDDDGNRLYDDPRSVLALLAMPYHAWYNDGVAEWTRARCLFGEVSSVLLFAFDVDVTLAAGQYAGVAGNQLVFRWRRRHNA